MCHHLWHRSERGLERYALFGKLWRRVPETDLATASALTVALAAAALAAAALAASALTVTTSKL